MKCWGERCEKDATNWAYQFNGKLKFAYCDEHYTHEVPMVTLGDRTASTTEHALFQQILGILTYYGNRAANSDPPFRLDLNLPNKVVDNILEVLFAPENHAIIQHYMRERKNK